MTRLDPAYYVVPLSRAEARSVPTRVDAWRRANPDAFRTWSSKYGCVVQFWGMRVYYGRCSDCSGLVTARRRITDPRYRRGETNIGRWPKYCAPCRDRRDQEHNDRARVRMRQLRERRRADAERSDRRRAEMFMDSKNPAWRQYAP